MKKLLKSYCQRAYGAAHACEKYASEVGFKLGFVEPSQYKKDRVLDKYRQKVEFPTDLPFIPVAVFSVGVTVRLATSMFYCLVIHCAYAFSKRKIAK